MQRRLVQRFQDLCGAERDQHPRVSRRSVAQEKNDKRDHQDRGELQAAQLCNGLKERMKRWVPYAGHRVEHLLVEHVQRAGGDREGQRDKSNGQGSEGSQAKGQPSQQVNAGNGGRRPSCGPRCEPAKAAARTCSKVRQRGRKPGAAPAGRQPLPMHPGMYRQSCRDF